jgi:3',5'-cyclic AMP phosphodiesterase CpdA
MMKVKTEPAPCAGEDAAKPRPPSDGEGFSLAHLSDLHLTSLANIKISQLLNKRLLGYFSWRHKRRIAHSSEIIESLLFDLRLTRPDHIAVTGDLTHLGLPHEFTEAMQWLALLGTPEQVTVIPGNHEAYAGRAWRKSCAMWAPYLCSDVNPDFSKTADFFPSLRIRGHVALIGLCSARPSLPFLAIGSLGKQQLARLEELLKNTGEAGLLRIILIHHPPVPGTIKWRKRLVDNQAFHDVLARHGAELVLHGHTHTSTFSGLPTPAGEIPVIGAPSASEFNPVSGRCAKYYIYRISRTGSNWEVAMSVRGYVEGLGRFVAETEKTLRIPPPPGSQPREP